MISEHDEIEAKLSAQLLDMKSFIGWMLQQPHIERYEHVENSPDDYYENGSAVVRHRGVDGAHELTVKRRKSDSSTRDREEIDLHFTRKTAHKSVGAFLRATGYKLAFQLLKDAHIFWIKPTPNLSMTYVIYDVWDADGPRHEARRFVEVEVEKGSRIQPETAKTYVRNAVKRMQAEMAPYLDGDPLNESLYEIFSGKRYSSI
jgi:adenylate cyclase class IV